MPKLKVRPTPEQARVLKSMLEYDQTVWMSYYAFPDHSYTRLRKSTLNKLIKEEWIAPLNDGEYSNWSLSKTGIEIAQNLELDDLISPPKLITSETVIAALRDVHPPELWFTVDELSIRRQGARRVDLLALNILNTFIKGKQRGRYLEVRVFEVKVDRGDFTKEIAHPPKYEAGMSLANRFYYAAPEGMIKIDELPEGAGLFEITKDGAKLTKQANWSECEDPTWRLIAAIARRLNNV